MKEAVAATHSRLTRLALFRAYSIPAGIAFAFLILVVSGALNLFSAGAQALIVYGFLALFSASASCSKTDIMWQSLFRTS